MIEDRLRHIATLPDLAEGSVRTAGTTRELFFRRAVTQLLRPSSTIPALNWLRSVSFAWRFYFARQPDRVVFFFGRKRNELEVVLDASLGFELQPVMEPLVEPPRLTEALAARLLWPNFLDPKPPSPEHIVFRLGTSEAPERLVVRRPDSDRRRRVEYYRSDKQIAVMRGDGSWRMEPFLAWLEGLRQWVRAPRAASSWEPIELSPSLKNRASRIIVDTVSGTFQRAIHATEPQVNAFHIDGVSRDGELSNQDPYRWMPCRQRLTNFSGSVILRLSPTGEIAVRHTDDPLSLELRYRLNQREAQTELELEVKPPDFLVGGELHQKFLRAFEEKAIEARFHQRLGLPNEAALRSFFKNGATEALVMRVQRRRDTDEDLLVLPGDIAGTRIVAVFQAEAKVTRDPQTPDRHHVVLPSKLHLLHPRSHDEDSEELRGKVVERFFRLMAALKNWGGLWP